MFVHLYVNSKYMCTVLSFHVVLKIFIPLVCIIQLEKALTYEKLMEWTKPSKMRRQEFKYLCPDSRWRRPMTLKSLLISMGMEDVV